MWNYRNPTVNIKITKIRGENAFVWFRGRSEMLVFFFFVLLFYHRTFRIRYTIYYCSRKINEHSSFCVHYNVYKSNIVKPTTSCDMCSTYMVYIYIYRYITLFEKLLFVTVTAHLTPPPPKPPPPPTCHRSTANPCGTDTLIVNKPVAFVRKMIV